MFKLMVKAGLAYGAIYYIKEEGVWKESTESLKACDKINAACAPYLTVVKEKIPFEIPTIPQGRTNEIMKEYWNRGVLASFKFLSELPVHVRSWAGQGIDMLKNSELKTLMTSSSTENVTEKK